MNRSIIDLEAKRIEKLPPQQLGRHLMGLPVRRRVELIVQRPDADAVVAAMPQQDFYLTVKEIGANDSLPLLALAQVPQLTHLFDLEWWQKDRIQSARALEWLERLARASEDRLLAWLHEADFDLLVALFKQWIRVVISPEDIDPLEAREQLPKNTIDDLYFWEVRYLQYEEFIRQLLSLLFEVHQGFYLELMNHLLWAIDVEAEEEAYRFHRARLEDSAIPDFYDALGIYRHIRPEELARNKVSAAEEAPAFALALLPEEDLLSQALSAQTEPAVLDTLQLELASLANKVVVADQLPPDSPDALHQAVDKVGAMVNLGLHLASGGDRRAATGILQEAFLEELFRLGYTQLARLRGRLQELVQSGWLARWPAGLHCLDSAWMEAAELLLGRTPKLLWPVSDEGGQERFIRTPQVLHQAKRLVDTLSALGLVFEALHPDADRLKADLWSEGQISSLDDVTLGAMLWTAAARQLWEGQWRLEPIPLSIWPQLFACLTVPAMEAAMSAWLEATVPEARARLAPYLETLQATFAADMAPFAGQAPPAPELVRLFLFTDR